MHNVVYVYRPWGTWTTGPPSGPDFSGPMSPSARTCGRKARRVHGTPDCRPRVRRRSSSDSRPGFRRNCHEERRRRAGLGPECDGTSRIGDVGDRRLHHAQSPGGYAAAVRRSSRTNLARSAHRRSLGQLRFSGVSGRRPIRRQRLGPGHAEDPDGEEGCDRCAADHTDTSGVEHGQSDLQATSSSNSTVRRSVLAAPVKRYPPQKTSGVAALRSIELESIAEVGLDRLTKGGNWSISVLIRRENVAGRQPRTCGCPQASGNPIGLGYEMTPDAAISAAAHAERGRAGRRGPCR